MPHLLKYCACGWRLYDTEVEDCPACHTKLAIKPVKDGEHPRP